MQSSNRARYGTPDYEHWKEVAKQMIVARWGEDHYNSMDRLIQGEGDYDTDIRNPKSGACGVAQALPCEKMKCGLDQTEENFKCQINWMNDYVARRYGDPTKAVTFKYECHKIDGKDVGCWY